MERRGFLSRIALAAGAGLVASPARALKFETMGTQFGAQFDQRCQVDPGHGELIKQASEKLADNPRARDALEMLAKDLKEAMTCPYCGCNLSLETDQTPKPARF